MTIKITSRAPTRIDLSGGTLDIWPLYLFVRSPLTVNLGIDLWANAELTVSPRAKDPGIVLRSADQGHELKLGWKDLASAKAHPALELHLKLLRHFVQEKLARRESLPEDSTLTLETRATSPAGAGLGGSSTLSIAMIGALATWGRGSIDILRDGESLIEIARDVETTVIKVPAGLQDYYGAMFGGLQSLEWQAGKHRREWLPDTLVPEVEKRLLLFYSGQSRNSGINNWALFKAMIDGDDEVKSRFQRISDATGHLKQALLKKDWTAVGQAIAEEWSTRKTLANGISTSEMDSAFQAALGAGAVAGKVCGAGGGGCFFVYLPTDSADARDKTLHSVAKIGVRPLPFKAVPRGLEVKVDRA